MEMLYRCGAVTFSGQVDTDILMCRITSVRFFLSLFREPIHNGFGSTDAICGFRSLRDLEPAGRE